MAYIDPNMPPDQMAALALEFLRPQLRPDANQEECHAIVLSSIKAADAKAANMASVQAQQIITRPPRGEVDPAVAHAEAVGGATASEILAHDLRLGFRL